MTPFQPLRFSKTRTDFYTTLNQRVNEYFRTHQLCRHANTQMRVKTVCMLALYFVPFIIMMTAGIQSVWIMAALCMVMGLGIAGIGLSVMHDACHGAYSRNPLVNRWLGYTLNMIGANAFNWKIQHNVLHHTYTNVNDVDEDVSQRGIFRLNPHAPWKPIHRFQHIYAWPLYGLMTFVWVFVKDITRLRKYQRDGLVERVQGSARREWILLFVSKVLYLSYTLVLPIVLLPFAWWQVFLGFFIAHYVAGFILAVIFQPAHVTSDSVFPVPDEHNTLENNWAIHQVLTTKNFANKSSWFSWYVGGLNFQIEHHLFPNICHVHYKRLSPIVQATALEFGLPYYHEETFFKAIYEHGLSLKQFGDKNCVAVPAALPELEEVA